MQWFAVLFLACTGKSVAGQPLLKIVQFPGPFSLSPLGTVDVPAGSQVILNCESSSNVTWRLPDVAPTQLLPQNRFANGRRRQESYMYLDASSRHSSNLTLFGLVGNDTGAIICQHENDASQFGSFFFLVNDPDTLCLTSAGIVSATQASVFQPTTVPCIATSSQTTVSLTYSGNRVSTTYNEQQGIVILQPTLLMRILQCQCTSTKGRIQTQLFRISVASISNLPPTIELPRINRNVFFVGEQFELLCSVYMKNGASVLLDWNYPRKSQGATADIEVKPANTSRSIGVSGDVLQTRPLVIKRVTLGDKGVYECATANTPLSTSAVNISVIDTAYVKVTDVQPSSNVGADVQDASVTLYVDLEAVPRPAVSWFKDGGAVSLQAGSKYTLRFDSRGTGNAQYKAELQINAVEQGDTGNYTFSALASTQVARGSFHVTVNVPPVVRLSPDQIYEPLALPRSPLPRRLLKCMADGVPAPTMMWRWQRCQSQGCIAQPDAWLDMDADAKILNDPQIVSQTGGESVLSLTPRMSGIYQCNATNQLGDDAATVQFIVGEASSNLGFLDRVPRTQMLAENELFELTCFANIWLYELPSFFRRKSANDYTSITNSTMVAISTSKTLHSNIITLSMNMTLSDSGDYGCEAAMIFGNAVVNVSGLINAQVFAVVAPQIVAGLNGSLVSMAVGSSKVFSCVVTGFPRPYISWYKDRKPLPYGAAGGLDISRDGVNLTIERAQPLDAAVYVCNASSKYGFVTSNMTLQVVAISVPSTRLSDTHIAIIIVIIVVLFATAIVVTVLLVRRYCRKKAIPHDFLLPSKTMINPDIPIDEQTDCLPYDAEWEFPRESLKLGMVLGQGAFGRVLKADAFGIEQGVSVTTVAVKTVRDPDDIEQIKALISELKILIHLGQHINIVNLLGAVTRRLKRGELLVIVEYCRYGNLRSYLLKHKPHYVDVLDDVDEQKLAAKLSMRRSVLSAAAGGGGDGASDDYLNSNSRSQMHCEENPLTTLDLLYWSYQIARGMQYLASIQYIHRDLAARNVLLSEDNIVKICDFGLAKDIYKYHEYKKKTDGPLPIKWMALESLTHKLFTTASDVWSFGVLLWELFNLAATPYPGVELNEQFIEKLTAGYRMEQPKHSPNAIYSIMLKCWHPEAAKRPTFADLSSEMGLMLSESVRNHYLQLEEPFTRLRDARQDYPPHYGVSGAVGDSDYLPVLPSIPAPTIATAETGDESGYYNTRTSKAVARRRGNDGTAEERVPLSESVVANEESEVFEGEDIPLPTIIAPSPLERYSPAPSLVNGGKPGGTRLAVAGGSLLSPVTKAAVETTF